MPRRLMIAPPDPRTHDPTVAEDILTGFFTFAGKVVRAEGGSPFLSQPPAPQWEAALSGFGWLRHLRVSDNPGARGGARTLVADFIKLRHAKAGLAWSAPVAARRLLSFVSASPFLLEGADLAFYRRFLRSIARHGRYLAAGANGAFPAEERLLPAIALCALALSSDAGPRLLAIATRALATEIRRCVLPDGGHASRSPRIVVDLLLDLLPLRHLFLARNLPPPEALLGAIDRMLAHLRLLRFEDGSLGLFHGTSYLTADALAIVFRYAQPSPMPSPSAPDSGFERIDHGSLTLLMDVGRPPPAAFSRAAHASALAFELADGLSRIIVNCGAPPSDIGPAREAARTTAAHSTLIVADTSSSRFGAREGDDLPPAIVDRPAAPTVLRAADDAGTRLTASHSGYARRFGLLHERGIAIDREGTVVHGLDMLLDANPRKPAGGVSYALRFHLHPSVEATFDPETNSVTLVPPTGSSWRFEAAGQRIRIEDSMFFATPDGARPTRQIVLQAQTPGTREIAWRLTRIGDGGTLA